MALKVAAGCLEQNWSLLKKEMYSNKGSAFSFKQRRIL